MNISTEYDEKLVEAITKISYSSFYELALILGVSETSIKKVLNRKPVSRKIICTIKNSIRRKYEETITD